MKTKLLAVLLLAAALPCGSWAQAQWNGYFPGGQDQHTLQLRVSDGDLSSILGTFKSLAQNITLPANQTSYVYLDLAQIPPVIVVNQTGFPSNGIIYKIAIAVTNGQKITALTDARPLFNLFALGGTAGTVTTCGSTIINQITKFSGSSAICNSSLFDDGTNPTQAPNGVSVISNGLYRQINNASSGTTLNLAVCENNQHQATTCGTNVTSGISGTAGQGAGTTGVVQVCMIGYCQALFDNQSVIGDWAVLSTTTPGEFHDTGSTVETVGEQNVLVYSANSGAGTIATVGILNPDTQGGTNGKGNSILVNGAPTNPTVNFNGTTPAANPGFVDVTFAASNPSSTNTNVTASYSLGIPINAQTGASYAMNGLTDRVSILTTNNASGTAVSIGQAGAANFVNNFAGGVWNIGGSGVTTVTPTTSTINGGASQIWGANWFGFIYSNNTNYFAPVMPTFQAFPNCADTGGNHLNFSPGTSQITCGTSSSGGSNQVDGTPNAGTTNFSDAGQCSNWSTSTVGGVTTQVYHPCHGLSFSIYNPTGLTASTSNITSYTLLTVPFACTIKAYNLSIDTGTITVKFWKVATGTAIPTSANSISTSGVSISSGTAIHSTTLTDFTTTAVAANDIMAMDITAVTGASLINGVLSCQE